MKMAEDQNKCLTSRELHALFDALFWHGVASEDVRVEIAPEGWDQSPLLACFHPSIERLFEERLRFHRNLEEWGQLRGKSRGDTPVSAKPEPTLEDVRREHEPSPVNEEEEVTELVGACLWDVLSDNHDVIAADGRAADIGSFRGAGAFLDEHLTRDQEGWREGDYLRFYLGTIWISGRTDLTPVYAMIFPRLQAPGADWVYHFPELAIVELTPPDDATDTKDNAYSVSQAAVAELEAQQRRAEVERFRAELRKANVRAREEAIDRRPAARIGVRAGPRTRRQRGRQPRDWILRARCAGVALAHLPEDIARARRDRTGERWSG